MNFVSKIVRSFTTKHPDQRTVRKSWRNVSLGRRFACLNDTNLRILAKAHKRLLAVLDKFSIYVVNDSLSPILTPSSLTLLLDFALLFSIINLTLLLSMFDPRNIVWNLPGFATILLILNQLRIDFTRNISCYDMVIFWALYIFVEGKKTL